MLVFAAERHPPRVIRRFAAYLERRGYTVHLHGRKIKSGLAVYAEEELPKDVLEDLRLMGDGMLPKH